VCSGARASRLKPPCDQRVFPTRSVKSQLRFCVRRPTESVKVSSKAVASRLILGSTDLNLHISLISDQPCPPNVLSLSCAAGPARRSRCGATAAATDKKLPEEASCGRRDAATLALHEVEWAAGRSRAATASAKSWAAVSRNVSSRQPQLSLLYAGDSRVHRYMRESLEAR